MKFKKQIAATAVVLILPIIAVIAYKVASDSNPAGSDHKGNGRGLVRQCPEHWYDNRMPGPESGNDKDRQYFIIDGERYGYSQVDVDWVKQNCQVNQPEKVY